MGEWKTPRQEANLNGGKYLLKRIELSVHNNHIKQEIKEFKKSSGMTFQIFEDRIKLKVYSQEINSNEWLDH